MPSSSVMAPAWSATATSLAPCTCSIRPVALPTLPKPWMLTVAPERSKPTSSAQCWRQNTTPCPVAFSRPGLPPVSNVLPVTIRLTFWLSVAPVELAYVSIIQTIDWALLPRSGAGMSWSGPMLVPRAWVNRRTTRSNSSVSSAVGSNEMPPLAPPNGMSQRADFQVIQEARALTSSRSTIGWNLTPPLYGPSRLLCWIR